MNSHGKNPTLWDTISYKYRKRKIIMDSNNLCEGYVRHDLNQINKLNTFIKHTIFIGRGFGPILPKFFTKKIRNRNGCTNFGEHIISYSNYVINPIVGVRNVEINTIFFLTGNHVTH